MELKSYNNNHLPRGSHGQRVITLKSLSPAAPYGAPRIGTGVERINRIDQ